MPSAVSRWLVCDQRSLTMDVSAGGSPVRASAVSARLLVQRSPARST
jgi:hypothetical protein